MEPRRGDECACGRRAVNGNMRIYQVYRQNKKVIDKPHTRSYNEIVTRLHAEIYPQRNL